MITIDRLEGAKFEPLRQQLRPRTADKATHIRSAHAKTTQPEVKEHRCCEPKMIPGAAIIPRPCDGVSLSPSIAGACQNKGPLIGRERQQSVVGRSGVLHPIDIVNLKV